MLPNEHPWNFPKLNWINHWPTRFILLVDAALSRRQAWTFWDPFQPEFSYSPKNHKWLLPFGESLKLWKKKVCPMLFCNVHKFSMYCFFFFFNYNPVYLSLMHEVAFKLSVNYMEWNGFSELLFLFQGRVEKQELSKQKNPYS